MLHVLTRNLYSKHNIIFKTLLNLKKNKNDNIIYLLIFVYKISKILNHIKVQI